MAGGTKSYKDPYEDIPDVRTALANLGKLGYERLLKQGDIEAVLNVVVRPWRQLPIVVNPRELSRLAAMDSTVEGYTKMVHRYLSDAYIVNFIEPEQSDVATSHAAEHCMHNGCKHATKRDVVEIDDEEKEEQIRPRKRQSIPMTSNDHAIVIDPSDDETEI